MAELERKDLVSDEALEAPKQLAKEFDKVARSLREIVELGKKGDIKVGSAKSTKAVRVESEKLTVAQKELRNQTVQIEKAQAKLNPEYQKGQKRLTELKVAQQENARKMKEQARESAGLTSEYQKQSARLNRLRKEYKDVALTQGENSKAAQKLRGEVVALDSKLKKVDASVGQHQRNVGNYGQAVQGVLPIMGGFGSQMQMIIMQLGMAKESLAGMAAAQKASATATTGASKALKLFRIALISTGVGALVVALGSLITFLTTTQRGIDKVTAVTRPLRVIFQRLLGVIQDLGSKGFDKLKKAIDNPTQAFKDLGTAIKDNILNRFKALQMFSDVLSKLWEGDFSGAAKTATDAVIQMGTGITDATDKISKAGKDTKDFIKESLDQGKQLDQMMKNLEQREIDLVLPLAKARDEFEKYRAIAQDQTKTDQERIEALNKAEKEQRKIIAMEKELIDLRVGIMELEQTFNDTDRAAQKELQELKAQQYAAETAAQKKINSLVSLRSGIEKRQAAERKAIAEAEAKEYLDLQEKTMKKRQEIIDKANGELKIKEEEFQMQMVTVTENAYERKGNAILKWIDKANEVIDKVAGKAVQVFDGLHAVISANVANNMNRLDEQMNAVQETYSKQIEAAEGNAERQAKIKERQAKAEEAIQHRMNAQRRKQAIADKALAIFQIGVETAKGVLKAVAASPLTFGLPWSAFVAGVGLAQSAAVIAQPIPQFAKGTDSSPEGPAIVNEQGPELMKTPDGKYQMAYSDGPTMTYLQKGTKVFTAKETEEMLNKSALSGFSSMPSRGSSDRSGDIIKELRENTKAIKKIKGTNVTVISDERWNKKVKERYA